MEEKLKNQASSPVKVSYRTNQIQIGLPKNRQDHPKRPKNTRWVISKRDGSLDTLKNLDYSFTQKLDYAKQNLNYGKIKRHYFEKKLKKLSSHKTKNSNSDKSEKTQVLKKLLTKHLLIRTT